VVLETIFERPSLDISDSLLKSLIYIHISVDKVLVLFINTTSLLNENLIGLNIYHRVKVIYLIGLNR
jgi:hypothetical protein